jgi:hypothetical protein
MKSKNKYKDYDVEQLALLARTMARSTSGLAPNGMEMDEYERNNKERRR